MLIRAGTIQDAAALAAFAARTFAETFAADNSVADMQAHVSRAYGVAQQTAELTSPSVITLIAEADGRLVGYAQLRRGPAPPCVRPEETIEPVVVGEAFLVKLYVPAWPKFAAST